MAVLLTVYLTSPPHTVRGLAEGLNVSKPAITRALVRLSAIGMIRRQQDDSDRRSVIVHRTVKGTVQLPEFGEAIITAARAAWVQPSYAWDAWELGCTPTVRE